MRSTREVDSVTSVAPVATIESERRSRRKEPLRRTCRDDQRLFRVRRLDAGERPMVLGERAALRAAVCIIGADDDDRAVRSARIRSAAGIRLRALSCSVIGLLQSKGKSTFGQDQRRYRHHADADAAAAHQRERRHRAGPALGLQRACRTEEGAAGYHPADARAPAPDARCRRRLQRHATAGDATGYAADDAAC